MNLLLYVWFVVSGLAFNISGTVSVENTALRVKRDDGMKVRFYRGQYKSTFGTSRGDALLRIERNDIWTNIPMSSVSLPYEGSFELPASRTGQTFDMSGTIERNEEEGPLRQGYEACTYTDEELVCYGEGRDRYCEWEEVIVVGEREVEYYNIITTTKLTADINSNNGGHGLLQGEDRSRRKVYTYEGTCY